MANGRTQTIYRLAGGGRAKRRAGSWVSFTNIPFWSFLSLLHECTVGGLARSVTVSVGCMCACGAFALLVFLVFDSACAYR